MNDKLWSHLNRKAIPLALFGLCIPALGLGLGGFNGQSITLAAFSLFIAVFAAIPDPTPRLVDAFKAILLLAAIAALVANFEYILSILM